MLNVFRPSLQGGGAEMQGLHPSWSLSFPTVPSHCETGTLSAVCPVLMDVAKGHVAMVPCTEGGGGRDLREGKAH